MGRFATGVPVMAGSLASLVVKAIDIHQAGGHGLYIREFAHLRYQERA